MTEATRPYVETLCRFYEEEIEGEAYFAELARRVDDSHARKCLNLLARVERHAADAVAPLIARHGAEPGARETLIASGRAEAAAASRDWAVLCAEMRRTYPGYVEDFRALEAMGPPEDQARLAFLTRHEVAAMEFLALEQEGARDSAAPLLRYLEAAPVGVLP